MANTSSHEYTSIDVASMCITTGIAHIGGSHERI
jgi:hypothetical protein